MSTPSTDTRYERFADFYRFYLSEHANPTCRRLHFIGTSLGLLCFLRAAVTANPVWVMVGLVVGYAMAWVGHFGFEKNKPASFKQPLFSFMGDWVMWWQILTRRIPF